jgi:hypothetical protein
VLASTFSCRKDGITALENSAADIENTGIFNKHSNYEISVYARQLGAYALFWNKGGAN